MRWLGKDDFVYRSLLGLTCLGLIGCETGLESGKLNHYLKTPLQCGETRVLKIPISLGFPTEIAAKITQTMKECKVETTITYYPGDNPIADSSDPSDINSGGGRDTGLSVEQNEPVQLRPPDESLQD